MLAGLTVFVKTRCDLRNVLEPYFIFQLKEPMTPCPTKSYLGSILHLLPFGQQVCQAPPPPTFALSATESLLIEWNQILHIQGQLQHMSVE
jgi:hypothetical protein